MFGKKSVANKIALIVTVLFTALIVVFSYLNYEEAKHKVVELITDEQEKIVEGVSSYFVSFLDNKMKAVKTLSKDIESMDSSDIQMYEKTINDKLHFAKNSADYALTYVGFAKDGRMLRSNGKNQYPSDGYDPRVRGWYKSAAATNQAGVSKPFIAKTSQKMSISLYSPVIINGKLEGVVSGSVGISEFTQVLLKMGKTEDSYIYVLDNEARAIIHPSKDYYMKITPVTKNIYASFKKNPHKPIEIQSQGKTKLTICEKAGSYDYAVCSIIEPTAYSKHTSALLKQQIIVSIIFILITAFLTYMVVLKNLKPISAIQKGLLSFFSFVNNESDSAEQINIKSNDEFGVMAEEINKNIDKIKQGLLEDKQMIDDTKNVVKSANDGYLDRVITANPNNPQLLELKDLVNEFLNNFKIAIGGVVNILNSYSNNDFTPRVPTQGAKGEKEALAKGLNNLGDEVSNMLSASLRQGEDLQEKAQSLTSMMETLTKGATEQSQSLGESAAAVEQISASMQNMSERANEVNSQGEDIKNVISIIKDIADQTNLLALNAAIEAARAGEHGRGFAVVADEVRNLAERTQKSLSEIEANTNILVQSINEMGSSINEQSEAVTQISQTVISLDDLTKQNATIAQNTNQVATDTNKMADVIVSDVKSKKF